MLRRLLIPFGSAGSAKPPAAGDASPAAVLPSAAAVPCLPAARSVAMTPISRIVRRPRLLHHQAAGHVSLAATESCCTSSSGWFVSVWPHMNNVNPFIPGCTWLVSSRSEGVRFLSSCPSESSLPPLSRRRRLRYMDRASLNPNSNSSSDAGRCDVIVSSGTHGGKDARLLVSNLGEVSTKVLPRSRRQAVSRKPLLPVEPRNLRQPGLRRKKRRRGRGDKCSAKGIRLKRDQQGRFKGPRSRTFEGGKTPLYRRLPKWPAAWLGRRRKRWEHLNLAKVRRFIEQGRLDARFPITQRHLHDSRCVKVRNGVHLFNVNDFPFPYKITIDVASADQSSIDAIRRVGGEVRVVYRHPINLRAHVKPYKFDVLPKTARPGLEAVHFLEKMRARGCVVSYIKPQWLEAEERRLQAELEELHAEAAAASGLGSDPTRPVRVDAEAIAAYRAKGLKIVERERREAKNG